MHYLKGCKIVFRVVGFAAGIILIPLYLGARLAGILWSDLSGYALSCSQMAGTIIVYFVIFIVFMIFKFSNEE